MKVALIGTHKIGKITLAYELTTQPKKERIIDSIFQKEINFAFNYFLKKIDIPY